MLAVNRIKAGGRFVKKQHRRLVNQRTRDRQQLLETTGQPTSLSVPLRRQIQFRKKRFDSRS